MIYSSATATEIAIIDAICGNPGLGQRTGNVGIPILQPADWLTQINGGSFLPGITKSCVSGAGVSAFIEDYRLAYAMNATVRASLNASFGASAVSDFRAKGALGPIQTTQWDGYIRIGFMGDSITYGIPGTDGFRLLVANALAADIGGTLPSTMTLQYHGVLTSGTPPVDHHTGLVGATAGSLLTSVNSGSYFGQGITNNVDLFMLMVGMNNASSDPARTAFSTDYPALVRALRTRLPYTRFVVSTVTNSDLSSQETRITSINAELPGIWDTLAAEGIPLTRIDCHILQAGDLQTDHLHLTASGNNRVYPVIYAGIKTALGY